MENQNNNNPKNRQGMGIILIATLLMAFIVFSLYSMSGGQTPEEISYSEFLKKVDAGEVKQVRYESPRLYITLKSEEELQEDTDEETGKADGLQDSDGQENVIQPGMNGLVGMFHTEKEETPDYYTTYILADDSLIERL